MMGGILWSFALRTRRSLVHLDNRGEGHPCRASRARALGRVHLEAAADERVAPPTGQVEVPAVMDESEVREGDPDPDGCVVAVRPR